MGWVILSPTKTQGEDGCGWWRQKRPRDDQRAGTRRRPDARAIGKDTQTYEVKSSRKRLARNICKTISAFSNGTGGTIICGLCERDDFTPIEDFDAEVICDSLAQACNERMTPPARVRPSGRCPVG